MRITILMPVLPVGPGGNVIKEHKGEVLVLPAFSPPVAHKKGDRVPLGSPVAIGGGGKVIPNEGSGLPEL